MDHHLENKTLDHNVAEGIKMQEEMSKRVTYTGSLDDVADWENMLQFNLMREKPIILLYVRDLVAFASAQTGVQIEGIEVAPDTSCNTIEDA